MSAPISVIIPTRNAALRIGPCLGAVSAALFEGLLCEVILADGGSTDEIAAVADACGARLVPARPGRGTQLAAGCAAARGQWLLIVHADSILHEGWVQAVKTHLAEHPDRAGYFRLRFGSTHPMAGFVAAWAMVRSRLLGLPYGDQGLLVPRTLYDRVGGYPDTPLMEDVALARRLRGRLRALDSVIETSAERYERDGWLRRGARNLWTQIRFFCGASPDRLARRYDSR